MRQNMNDNEVTHISGMNETPAGDRVVIGFFGRRNVGKSSVVNAVTGQNLAVVSDIKGTTTDPVQKAMELLPLGPVLIIDTPGFDDKGALGEQRVRQARKVLNKTDVAVLVVDATEGMTPTDDELVAMFEKQGTPYVIAYNKSDLPVRGDANATPCTNNKKYILPADEPPVPHADNNAAAPTPPGDIRTPQTDNSTAALTTGANTLHISALTGDGVEALKEKIARSVRTDSGERRLIGDLIAPGDFIVLVVPIDKAAPKGRLILPQQQVIRDALESGATAIVVRESELKTTLKDLGKTPALVVTDSQVFKQVSADTPSEIPLTSFSILFARYKGDLDQNVRGVRELDEIKEGDKVLICEGCTHHRQCDDIGTVKLPRWIEKYTGSKPEFDFVSGGDFPDDPSRYKLIVHCGGCMLNEREMKRRQKLAASKGTPMTNYGILIAQTRGILKRAIAPLDVSKKRDPESD
jgi:small GTP-binding protein